MVETIQRAFNFLWGDVRLAGTLHLPPAPPPHPVVLMLQGSGPADRDSGGYFPPIRETFLSRGIATYSFDKPGIGGSSGDWRRYALAGRTDQALAAIALLREHEAIDAQRVGVWGQSQGGWLVQMLAARLPNLAFAIANSGCAIGVAEQDRYGCEHTMRAEGKSEEQIERALAFINALHAAALRGDTYASVERQLLTSSRGESWYGYLSVEGEEDWEGMSRFVTERYEPTEALAQARCPFLALFGALDVLAPAWKSAEIYSRSLHEAGNQDATIVVFPQGNHRILVAETGEFVPGYLDLLGDWAARRVAQPPSFPSP
jgi:pimeloyl-ACP methyl ester carboxylesterase